MQCHPIYVGGSAFFFFSIFQCKFIAVFFKQNYIIIFGSSWTMIIARDLQNARGWSDIIFNVSILFINYNFSNLIHLELSYIFNAYYFNELGRSGCNNEYIIMKGSNNKCTFDSKYRFDIIFICENIIEWTCIIYNLKIRDKTDP